MKRTEAPSKIPNWLAVLPKNANITTREFAIALGVSGRTLARRDTPKPDWLSGRTYRRKAPSRPYLTGRL